MEDFQNWMVIALGARVSWHSCFAWGVRAWISAAYSGMSQQVYPTSLADLVLQSRDNGIALPHSGRISSYRGNFGSELAAKWLA